jgi:hypothetical protein
LYQLLQTKCFLYDMEGADEEKISIPIRIEV